ncbi:MAG: endolytic transglycosylase MltG [Candidatus Paceibacterota bacterium]
MLNNIFLRKYLLLLKDFLNRNLLILISTFCILIVSIFFYVVFLSTPKNFPLGTIYDLKSGQTLSGVSEDFVKKEIIKSDFWFKSFVYLFTTLEGKILEGDYTFNKKENVLSIAWRVSHGEMRMTPIKVVIPEGLNSFEIADILSSKLVSFDKKVFLENVKKQNLEGYLFPDTYLFLSDIEEIDIITIMNDNFNNKIKILNEDIKKFGKSLSDIVKMASIIEGEARVSETRRIVSGILWNRISIGMALQVDSSFKYINGKTTATLSLDDLKIDSPYNSYTNKGLPPTPISNPGLGAIRDTIMPTKTSYLYFLTDDNGLMHYAVTHNEHVNNKEKYLK